MILDGNLIDLGKLTSERGLQMNKVLSNVKFELQREEDKLKNGTYEILIMKTSVSIFQENKFRLVSKNHLDIHC